MKWGDNKRVLLVGLTASLVLFGAVLGCRRKGDSKKAVVATPATSTTTGASTATNGSATTTAAAFLQQARAEHTTTVLASGDVLVAGGQGAGAAVSNTAEVYRQGAWTATSGTLVQPRYQHSATALSSGKVLIAGGRTAVNGAAATSTELYDPATGRFSVGPNLSVGRALHSATALTVNQQGFVLLAGGTLSGAAGHTSLDLYIESSNIIVPASPRFVQGRFGHQALVVGQGKVLFVGGQESAQTAAAPELFDATTNTMSAAGKAALDRVFAASAALVGGSVLFTGGNTIPGQVQQSAEVYDPATGLFSAVTQSMSQARQSHTATSLATGDVLVVGGQDGTAALTSIEVFQAGTPATAGSFSPGGSLSTARHHHGAAALPGGGVLLIGGYDGAGQPTASVELVNATAAGSGTNTAPSTGTTPGPVTPPTNPTPPPPPSSGSSGSGSGSGGIGGFIGSLFGGSGSGSGIGSIIGPLIGNLFGGGSSSGSGSGGLLSTIGSLVGNLFGGGSSSGSGGGGFLSTIGGLIGNLFGGGSSSAPAPQVAGLSPNVGPVGTVVVISGSNFSSTVSDNQVRFGNVSAFVFNATSTAITTQVPAGASSGPVTVTVKGKASNAAQFVVQ